MNRLLTGIALIAVSTLALCGPAAADDWECLGSSSAASCYVTYVRFYPGKTTYVQAKLHDPDGTTTCNYARVSLNSGGSGASSVGTVRGAEAILLTALTTGLPIKFYRLTDYGDDSVCWAGTVIVAKPGH